jgi:hypothetical protein
MSVMSGQKYGSVKSLLESVPPGFIVDSAWLEASGIGRRSVYDYVKQGWLERLAHGVFRRPIPSARSSEEIDWKICVLSMQHIMGYPVHVGGMTALALQGYSHYLALGDKATVWLYGADLPNWLKKLPLGAPVENRSRHLFRDPELGQAEPRGEQSPNNTGNLPWNWPIRMSAPERAVLEALDELPDHESFHNLDMVFEGLTTLRPKLLASLLNDCRKIKVRRLFFVFADRHGHAWRKRVHPEDFDLGRGDRALVKGGRLHRRYRIVVPEGFSESEKGAGHAD